MEKIVFNQVYDILNCMDLKYQRRIPNSLKNLIKTNRDLFYDTGIKTLPKNLDDVKPETKALLGIIYKKYFMNTVMDISDSKKNKIIYSLKNKDKQLSTQNLDFKLTENTDKNIDKNQNLPTIQKNNNIFKLFKKIIFKIKEFFVKK